ncbi:hypothetical protein H5P28_09935 [Ruficoccus amylovorans]|uniref:Uncharacterized protein n=1 Tax=Ruficoccus amylovorans TaxID=1804625 RepID=A0A842HEW0_9BACT|nr:hypothetical protein [Ruficoccus amylovorans]MBC2594578.1 hypothetical protein [Ruficoccus amylovorans]
MTRPAFGQQNPRIVFALCAITATKEGLGIGQNRPVQPGTDVFSRKPADSAG